MEKYGNGKNQKIKIEKLIVFKDNPRHRSARDEDDAIRLIFEEVGKISMLNLAKDISENGLLGNQSFIVVPSELKKGYFDVYDGNRRTAALKVLNHPEKYNFLSRQNIRNLKKWKAKQENNYSINCFVTDKETAVDMIRKIHAGEDNGRGFKSWSAEQKKRYELKYGDKKVLESLILYYNDEYFPNSPITDILPITSLKRVFDSKKIKNSLGITKDNVNSFTKDRIILIRKAADLLVKKAKEDSKKVSRLNVEEINSYLLSYINDEIERIPLSSYPLEGKNNNFIKESSNKIEKKAKKDLSGKIKTKKAETPYFFQGLDLSSLNENESDHFSVIKIGNELITFTRNKDVKNYPLSVHFLIRTMIENCLILLLKSTFNPKTGKKFWDELRAKVKNSAPTMRELTSFITTNKTEIIGDRNIERLYEDLIENKKTLIEPLNITIHSPGNYQFITQKIEGIPQEGILALINFLIKKSLENSGQK